MTTILMVALAVSGAATLIAGDHLLASEHRPGSRAWLRAHPWALTSIAVFVLLLAAWTFWTP